MPQYAITAADNAKAKQRSAFRSRQENLWRIEGEYVTIREIAERLGICANAASNRLRRLQGATGAITWARLAA